MHMYKRGKVWWIEYIRKGTRYRQSTHTKDKEEAKGVLAVMQSGMLAKCNMATIVSAVCEFYGRTLQDALPDLCAAAGLQMGDVARDAETALDPTANTLLFDDVKQKDGPTLRKYPAWNVYVKNMDALGLRPMRELTLERRGNEYRRFVRWLEGAAPMARRVRDVNGKVAMAYAVELGGSGKSTKTRKNIIGELGTIWKVLAKACGVANVWANLAPKDVDGKVGEAFTREEEERVFAAAKKVGKDWFEVCKTMRHTGLRYADVANLKWSEVDLDERMIHRVPTKTMRHKITVHVPICASLLKVLRGMKRTGDEMFPLHAELYGNRGRAARAMLSFAEVLTAAGISRQGISVHSWRHTFVTRLAEAGVDKETRKRLAGHTQDATSERYDHAKYHDRDLKAVESAA